MKKISNTVLQYPAVFAQDTEGFYNVSFPDFPGCATFGKNFEEAHRHAEEVLSLWIEELTSQNQKIKLHGKSPILSEITVALPKNLKVRYEIS